MLPNFLCVGAQKAGTTTLFDLLNQHPQIYLPTCKEVHFFDKDERYLRGLQWYESEFFSQVCGEKAVGEITPIYMYLDYVPRRIYESLGADIKLIFMLRNPIDRAYSHYWMIYSRGYEKESFEAAIDREKKRIQSGEFERIHYSYIDRGFYCQQIRRYLNFFPKRNMCFIIFEKFVNDMPRAMGQIFAFLEVDWYEKLKFGMKSNPATLPRSTLVRDLVHGRSSAKAFGKQLIPSKRIRGFIAQLIDRINTVPVTKPPLSKETRSKLADIYRSDIEQLGDLLGKDLTFWLDEGVMTQ